MFLVKFKRFGTSIIKELTSKTMANESITETTVKQSMQRVDRGHCWEVTNKHFELILTQMISI